MPAKVDLEREAKMIAAYLGGMEPLHIAARFGGSRQSVYNILKRHGHPAKNPYKARTGPPAPGLRAKDLPPERYLDRDPCFCCGATGMAGCEHRRAS